MKLLVDTQIADPALTILPLSEQQIQDDIQQALICGWQTQEHPVPDFAEITLRFCTCDEIQALNRQYRHKNKPTNILSFPADLPDFVPSDYLGDLLVCYPVIVQEARQQYKTIADHLTHILVHGCLHLIGYDHISEDEAKQMEQLEIEILRRLDISNPYGSEDRG